MHTPQHRYTGLVSAESVLKVASLAMVAHPSSADVTRKIHSGIDVLLH